MRKYIAAFVAIAILAIGATVAATSPNGLVAAYGFNTTGTVIPDDSGNNNTGLSGTTTVGVGKNGSGRVFNGTTGMVTIADKNSLDLTTNFTIEAWVKPTTVSGWKSVVLKEAPSGLAYSLYAGSTSGPGAWIRPLNTGSDTAAVQSAKLPVNTWSHISTTYDGKVLRYYTNGVLKSSKTVSSLPKSVVSSTGKLYLGGNTVWGEFFKGTMDDVRIYNRTLSAAELKDDMNVAVDGGVPTTTTTTVPTTTSTSTTSTTTTSTTTTVAPTTTSTTTTTVPATTTTTTTVPPTTVPGELPAGVTLQEPDGGKNYMAKWSNGFPSDPSFFPIAVWGESFTDDSVARARIDTYTNMGINFYNGDWGIPSGIATYMNSKGLYSNAGGGSNPAKGGQTTTDEPDWRGCANDSGGVAGEAPAAIGQCSTMNSATGASNSGPTAPSFMKRWADYLRGQDPTRPVWVNYTKVQKSGTDAQDYWVDDADARAYIEGADLVSYDWYILQDAGHYTPASWGFVWKQGDATRNIRRLANYAKPVSVAIGVGYVNDYSTVRPSAADLNSEVWNAIIGGARGITYFQHDFKVGTAAALLDSRYVDLKNQAVATNALIKSLAPVINSDYANGYLTAPTGINTMVKYHQGSFYVFATSRQLTATGATFNVKAGSNIEVIGENRSLSVVNGSFSDSFANQNAVHIYKITP